ncbi:4a-hydroxytetrahydrobiopterin dehydratase [Microbacterium sp. 4R-513]|uniref:4a-hydroxytetrahydrobiopterin dehydratase n=1 Tax=Microbacterium sp. 4R-513 TaxID=2567934 RepID=UPI0013E19601|nr:4a-hydroxytetrahydrobiopterin dehydratase [Microbacterium sp. 4R-513]QIG39835.1 4a-hydroxytetrahydrobiopterin dehydratase [Microbacterium sp. 4R-513]
MDTISAADFRAAAGADGWRAGANGAHITYTTRNFATGARLFSAIAALAETADHHPDVDVRYRQVSVHLFTHSANGLTRKDVALAQQIAAAARDLGVEVDVTTPQRLMLAIATEDPAAIMPFWKAATGYDAISDTELRDPSGRGPLIWMQKIDKPLRGRSHLDIVVPRDEAEARVAAVLAAGGTIADDSQAPRWWTLSDAHGHKIDITPSRS